MFDIGFSEMVLLAIIALVVIGPKQLPEVARMAARFVNDVKRITAEFSGQFLSARDQATKFVTETQSQITNEITKIENDVANGVATKVTAYEEEPVVPPPIDGPVPAPDPGADMAAHAPYDTGPDGEPEQMSLNLEAPGKKGRDPGAG